MSLASAIRQRDVERDDLAFEKSRLRGGDGPLMTEQGISIEGFA